MIRLDFKNDVKATIILCSLFGLGGLSSSPPISCADSIANIKGLSYLTDRGVINLCLGVSM